VGTKLKVVRSNLEAPGDSKLGGESVHRDIMVRSQLSQDASCLRTKQSNTVMESNPILLFNIDMTLNKSCYSLILRCIRYKME
jgi:hypothetical protein